MRKPLETIANLRTFVARGPLLGKKISLLSPGSLLFLVLIANLLLPT